MSGVHRMLTFMATALCMVLPAAARAEGASRSGTDADAAGKVKQGLAVHPDGHYFTLDGEPVVLFGAGNWVAIPAGERRHPFPVDYELIHRTVAQFNANANRSTLYAFGDAEMMPWVHEDGRFDLDRWNAAYWQRLRSYLRSAHDHGIVPIIQVFDHPSAKPHRDPQRWQSNPFNPANNVNDMGELPTEGYHPPRDFYNVLKLIRNDRVHAH